MDVYFKDEFIEQSEVKISSHNRAFKYGDGLFESVLIINGKANFISYHLNRLLYGMQILGIEIPSIWDVGFFQSILSKLSIKNACKNARCKISVWRDGAGLYLPEKNEAIIFIELFPIKKYQFEINTKGIRVGVFEQIEKMIHPLSSCKSLNAIPYILAAKFANEQNLDDVVLLNTDKKIADCSSSNVFIVKNNVVYTTNANNGGVMGTMQQILLDHASAWNINMQRLDLRKEDLLMADEFFLTNAMDGIKWVSQFESKSFGSVFTQKIMNQLNSLLK